MELVKKSNFKIENFVSGEIVARPHGFGRSVLALSENYPPANAINPGISGIPNPQT